MGKRDKGNKKKHRKGSPFADHNISGLGHHQRIGTKLIPPFGRLPKAKLTSWSDHHAPEMLWAVLLTGTLERRDYLLCFRAVAALARGWFACGEAAPTSDAAPQNATEQSENGEIYFSCIVDQSKLSEVDDESFRAFLAQILSHPLGYAALRPLLLIDGLPGLDRWRRELSVEPIPSSDWLTLATSIGGVLDHQSEQSTDIRWFKVVVPSISGQLRYPTTMADHIEELRLFPDKGDMRKVRPMIRASEMMIRRARPAPWITAFWTQLLKDTKCLDPSTDAVRKLPDTCIDPRSIFIARREVIDRFLRAMNAERTDPRLDSAFGFALFALSIVEEASLHRLSTRIAGRALLRALAETCITFRYLAHRDEEALWLSYRVYGAGQAKLAFLKAQELDGDLPNFLDETALHTIANEDTWQEFLNIDIGHWANSNLRKLAMDSGAKDIYDQYYDWTSGFIHGNWGAVRDSNFITCHNPLHRLHRIPRIRHRLLEPVEADCVKLTNDMLSTLNRLYPQTSNLPEVVLKAATQVPPASDASNAPK